MTLHTQENELVLYLRGNLAPDDRLQVKEHLESCTECARLVDLLLRAGEVADAEERGGWDDLLPQQNGGCFTDDLVATASELLMLREMGVVRDLFEKVGLAILDIQSTKNAAAVLNLYCQWLDTGGFSHIGIEIEMSYLENAKRAISDLSTAQLSRIDQIHLDMAEG